MKSDKQIHIEKQAVRDFIKHIANHKDISKTDFYVMQEISDKYLETIKWGK